MAAAPKSFLALRIDPELLASIDDVAPNRGRTKWIEDACRRKLAGAPVEKVEAIEALIAEQTVSEEPAPVAAIDSSCPHIILGVPRQDERQLWVRDCKACGSTVERI